MIPPEMSKNEMKSSSSSQVVSARRRNPTKKNKNTSVTSVFSLDKPLQFSLRAPMDQQVYKFVLTSGSNAITSSTGTEVDTSIVIKLNLLNNYADLTAVFDQYRIDEVELLMIPRFLNTTTGTNCGDQYSVVDYDDSGAATIATLLQYTNVVITSGSNGRRIRWKPHVAMAAYTGSAFTDFANVTGQWIDSASADVPHYGVKHGWSVTSSALTIDYFFRALVSFRNVV